MPGSVGRAASQPAPTYSPAPQPPAPALFRHSENVDISRLQAPSTARSPVVCCVVVADFLSQRIEDLSVVEMLREICELFLFVNYEKKKRNSPHMGSSHTIFFNIFVDNLLFPAAFHITVIIILPYSFFPLRSRPVKQVFFSLDKEILYININIYCRI